MPMPANSTPNTILLKGEAYLTLEGDASAAITPGMLVERHVVSTVQKIRPHATADGAAQKAFAFEHETIGKGITDNYAVGDRVKYLVVNRGAEIYALVPAAAPAIVVGDILGSNGDGRLKKVTVAATTLAGSEIAVAIEAVDNSAGGSPARIRVQVL
jgi:hypothetical protein